MAWNETSGTAWTFFEGRLAQGQPAPSWVPWTMRRGWAPACSMAAAPLKAWPLISISIASAWSVRPKVLTSRFSRTPRKLKPSSAKASRNFPRLPSSICAPCIGPAEGFVDVDPESTKFSVSVYDSPLPKPTSSFSITLSPFRRPSNEYAPTDAKAACHYPNSARAIRDAKARGFDNAVMLDPLGHVAELTTANIWCAKNGEAYTPVPNGCFLNGITRQRIISLLNGRGHQGS